MGFFKSIIAFRFISWYSALKQSFSFLHQYRVMDSHCIHELLSVIVIIIYFYAPNLPDLASGCPFTLISISFQPVPIILWVLCHLMAQAILGSSHTETWNQPFLSQKIKVPSSREWYLKDRILALGVCTATEASLSQGPLSGQLPVEALFTLYGSDT